MNSTQMLKGILQGCLLAIISEEEIYGYEMVKKLKKYGFDMVSEGSIYPLLIRMKKEDLVTTITKASASGPKRKYYLITDKGREQLLSFIKDWDNLSLCVENLLKNNRNLQGR
ncbi:PadR family transcriptional regulator [[Clostridium] sordellii]|uniref:PadR family transcriptional regulator n=1 Tax=Paraclostridium sordellii TaxID=1505 RepID=UPI0002D49E5C|nr:MULTISPECIES: PadR family transcriptional regulator [Paeniclostridium]MBW4862760.1 PadR family transcriptional regulator [Paeniclostridium sp.]MBW4875261.1 PadR family transcriptional regulator [Paeniclostridium sp.]MDU7966508.1 PadR family transcriptional regulator [Paeniclostridium sordellii]RGX02187.1 PadR family transcriptional regulator [Paeniclostridium sordellii]TAN64099.1 PadR family transcriptional regulator [Paeniclostridium sordellii 8483]